MSEETTPWLLQFESGKKWYNLFKSEQTKTTYIERLEHYCKTVAKTPDELVALKVEGLKNINSEKEWQAEDLLDNYLYSPETKLTIHLKALALSAVKSFYKSNWRDLNPKDTLSFVIRNTNTEPTTVSHQTKATLSIIGLSQKPSTIFTKTTEAAMSIVAPENFRIEGVKLRLNSISEPF